MPDEPVWEKSAYSEAGNMLRHYSISRSSVLSITMPAAFAMLGFAIDQASKGQVITALYLLFAECVLFVFSVFLAIFFSTKYEQARICLARIEEGETGVRPYAAIVSSRPRKGYYIDGINWSVILIGVIFHGVIWLVVILAFIENAIKAGSGSGG